MKVANVIEGGIAGASTLAMLEKALQGIDSKTPGLKLLNKPGIIKRLRKESKKKGSKKIFVKVAKELLTAGGYYGIVRWGKKNALLRGALLGLATGLGVVFAESNKDKKNSKDLKDNGYDPDYGSLGQKNRLLLWISDNKEEILTVALYTAGGVLAGAALKKMNKKSKKR
jgi:hypothetical protein